MLRFATIGATILRFATRFVTILGFAIRHWGTVAKLVRLAHIIYTSVQPASPGGMKITKAERDRFDAAFWSVIDEMLPAVRDA